MKTAVNELRELVPMRRQCRELAERVLTPELRQTARRYMDAVSASGISPRDEHGLLRCRMVMSLCLLFAEKIEADPEILAACALTTYVRQGMFTSAQVRRDWGDDVALLIDGMLRVKRYSDMGIHADQDNFRGLLLSLASDIRVIIIMIVENLALMRAINLHPDEKWVQEVAFEANCLYAQLAHRLGLYAIKGELEDLSLKYTDRKVYKQIAARLNETKRDRDAYIADFIKPVSQKLSEAGLKFEIKGRTKSISSIWAKIRKKKVDMSDIYDLFAIRVILDSPPEKEKQDCWLAYSIVADMYRANPARMRDWITIPKSNGYESLHATVMGPRNKWVEVQFRSRAMDLVAEKGLAAHWRYKGGHADVADRWMNNVREVFENADEGPMRLMKDMKIDAYGGEGFAFTPKGDLLRLPAGATVLDFAFQIHSRVGEHCVGAVVNGAHKKINYRIQNGDSIEIVTSPTQTAKQDWLNIVVTSKACNKIRQSLNEERTRRASLGKELLQRRARNRKVEIDEALLMRLIKKMGYKYLNDFFADVADEKVDAAKFIARYTDALDTESKAEEENVPASAEGFKINNTPQTQTGKQSEVLTIGDKSLRGMNYRFARCCNPIYGDDVFGFISSDGIVKIHKSDCSNAANIRRRYPYRIISTRWSEQGVGEMMPVTLRIVGNDDIEVVTTVTSMIQKSQGMTLRNISIDSHDGIFQGYMTIGIADSSMLNRLLQKIKSTKGIKDVSRS
ncbi:MAG TPA: RelA/SpoT family protein [Porphyromonadaceae bacterium]|nr:RelA/SpoT family protein [Porphyromonadaceae bacterium]